MSEQSSHDYYIQANAAARSGNMQQAVELYDQCLQIDLSCEEAWCNKGMALYRLVQTEEAFKCFERALEIDPNDALAWVGKANCHYGLHEYDKSIECLNKAIEINPLNREAWFNKGVNLYYSSSFPEAIECFDVALKLDPGYEKAKQFKQMTEEARKMNQRAQKQREVFASSPTDQIYLNIPVDGIYTMYIKMGPGIDYSLYLTQEGLQSITPNEAELIRQKQIALGHEGLIGGIQPQPENPQLDSLWSPFQSTVLDQHLCHAEDALYKRVELLGSWPSFEMFLKEETLYDASTPGILKQNPMEYWWLAGDPKQSDSIHRCRHYDDAGIFIKPKDQILPVFTSGLYADLMAQFYRETYHVDLKPRLVHCLGCYLTGLREELEPFRIKAALLNDQWPIQFQDGNEGKYYLINDGSQRSYTLIGCPEKGENTIWIDSKYRLG